MSKVLLSLSGGMDSVSLLGVLHSQGHQIEAVMFDYGSKHNPFEKLAATYVGLHYDVPLTHINVSNLFLQMQSNLLAKGGPIPEGHYQQDNMSLTVVPGRNSIFTTILLGMAQSKGFDHVALGIHSGDHVIYPDCRPEWFTRMRAACWSASENDVTLVAPFIDGNKTSIIKQGLALDVPYRLTRTCYSDQKVACGRCGSCQERLEAFAANGVDDPIDYAVRELLPKQ